MQLLDQLRVALEDRYEVLREIGAGGMATVFLARDARHDRHVALKVLTPELGAVLGVERFLAEIRVTANLQHPNLLPLFDSGEAGGLLFYVMPFIEGESLRVRLEREKQLPVDEAIRIATAVAAALDYAHRHDVIHRDLKPENILLHEGQPLIADFGIALAVTKAGGNRITQTGLSLGTPQYMSPEQATGDRAIDGRTDVYSLGAMTYEMLAGDPPHTGSTSQAVIAHLLTERPRSLRAARATVAEHVDLAVQRALEKLPADRWATAGQFADALQGKIATVSVGATARPTRPISTWRGSLRSPLVMSLTVIALAAVAVAARERIASRAARPQDVVQFALTYPAGIRPFTPATAPGMALSPDGSTLAFIASDEGGTQRLYVRSLDNTLPRTLPGTEAARLPFFAPDGRWIGFWANGRLMKVAIDGSATLPLASTTTPYGASWGAQDRIVFSEGRRLLVVSSNGGEPRFLTQADTAAGFSELFPLVLADGETVLYSRFGLTGSASSSIAVVSLSTGESSVLDLPGTFPLGVADGRLIFANGGATVFAVPFDVRQRRVSGTPEPVATDILGGAGGFAKASLSASGSLTYVTGSPASHVVVVDSSGASRVLMNEPRSYLYPRYSPNGQQIAITIGSTSRSDIWIYDVASGTPTRFTADGVVNERPEWSADGKRILFRTVRDQRSALWWRPSDLSGPAQPLLADARANYYEGVITPDGRTLVYQVDTTGSDLMYRSLEGDTASKPVAMTRFAEDRARVSHDGRWIAFQTDESGAPQVVVQPFPGGGARVQVSAGGGTEPVWGHDGRRLYYRDGEKIVAVTYAASPDFRVVARVALFDDVFEPGAAPHANYDVSPRGTRFLFLQGVAEPQLIVIHNWAASLRTRVAQQR